VRWAGLGLVVFFGVGLHGRYVKDYYGLRFIDYGLVLWWGLDGVLYFGGCGGVVAFMWGWLGRWVWMVVSWRVALWRCGGFSRVLKGAGLWACGLVVLCFVLGRSLVLGTGGGSVVLLYDWMFRRCNLGIYVRA
jgi:hypothetical protein